MEKNRERRDSKNVLIGTLLAAVLIMAVGYAALAQQLRIDGTATISGTWDVQIESITEANKTGQVVVTDGSVTSTGTTAQFDVKFNLPGDSVTFDVVIANNGTIDAKLANFTKVLTDPDSTKSRIYYDVTGVNENQVLAAGAKTTVKVTARFDNGANTSMPTDATNNATVTFNYVQAD